MDTRSWMYQQKCINTLTDINQQKWMHVGPICIKTCIVSRTCNYALAEFLTLATAYLTWPNCIQHCKVLSELFMSTSCLFPWNRYTTKIRVHTTLRFALCIIYMHFWRRMLTFLHLKECFFILQLNSTV